MIEEFPPETSEEQKKKEEESRAELPEDIVDAVRGRGEYDISRKGNWERALNRIEEWLSTANTEKELQEMLYRMTGALEEWTGEEPTQEARILQDLLIRQLLKNRKKEIEG